MIAPPFDPKSLKRESRQGHILNAMSVDVEDYFQVQALVHSFARPSWEDQELRVEKNMASILDLFAKHDTKATFFTLGWIAERIPSTIKRIVSEGHELASHGYDHKRIFEQNPETFRADIRRTKRILEDLSGTEIRGYRAATFSIREDVLWAYEILAEEGYAYSSSVYPVKHDLYGMSNAPRFAFLPTRSSRIVEYPMTTLKVGNRIFPGGGGGYFRLFPYSLSKQIISRTNTRDRQPFMFYFHPWEIDPGQPRPKSVPLKSRLRHYTNLAQMEAKIERLLTDFSWTRVDQSFVEEGDLNLAEAAE